MPEVVVPRVDRTLTTRHVLAMDWIEGEPLEALASEAVPQARRNAVARTLYELMFRELFEFHFVQTDPNFANCLYLPATQQVALLDLGSVGEYPAGRSRSHDPQCRGHRPAGVRAARTPWALRFCRVGPRRSRVRERARPHRKISLTAATGRRPAETVS